MDKAAARRYVRRDLATAARQRAADLPDLAHLDADARSRVVDAYGWLAEFLARGETSVLPANLRPLVRADGTPPDGASTEWSAHHDPDREDSLSA